LRDNREHASSEVSSPTEAAVNRTGVIIAIYRMMRDCWTAKRALQEAKRYGMGWIQFRKRDYIKDFFEERFRRCYNAFPTPIQPSSN
jgi:hypothetical protein